MRLQLADIYLKLDRLDEAEKEIDRVAPNSGLSERVEALRRILNSEKISTPNVSVGVKTSPVKEGRCIGRV